MIVLAIRSLPRARAATYYRLRWAHPLAALAGPALIIGSVLAVLHDFAFRNLLTSQHPDILAFWLPNYCFLGKSLAAWHIPGWNPFAMGGLPFAADPQSGWMYLPATGLFSSLSCAAAMRWMIVLQPALAGLGLYFFLTGERLSRAAATIGGLTLALSLASSRLGLFLPFPSALAWTTIVLAACSRYLQARTWPGRLLWLLLTAAAWGQLAGAHFAHGVIIGTLILAAYLIIKNWMGGQERPGTRRQTLALTALLVPAVLLVNLAYLLPRIAYLSETSYRVGYSRLQQISGLPLSWPLQLAMSPGMHVAAVALALAFAGWWSRPHRRLIVGFAVFGVLSYVAGLEVVTARLSKLLVDVPLLDSYTHYPGRVSLGLLPVLAILAGVGAEAWRGNASARSRLAMVAPGVVIWGLLPPSLGAPAHGLVVLAAGAVAGGLVMAAGTARPWLVAALPVIVAAETVTSSWLGLSHSSAPNEVAAVTRFGGDSSGWFGPVLHPTIDADLYLRPGPLARALRASPNARFLSFDRAVVTRRGYLTLHDAAYWGLLANQRSMLFGIRDVQGYNPVQIERYWTYVRRTNSDPIDYNAAVLTDPPSVALDLLQVEYIVSRAGEPPESGALPIGREGIWALYRRRSPGGTPIVTTAWKVVPGPDEALTEVVSNGFDPFRLAVVEADPRNVSPLEPSATPVRPTIHAVFLGEQSARVRLETRSPAIVVMPMTYGRNWHAAVDGRTTDVFPADYVLQGVAVGPGAHTVVFTYDDPTIGAGLAGSAIAVLAFVVAMLVAWRVGAARDHGGASE